MIKFQTVLIVLFFVPAIGFAQSNDDPWPDLPVSLNGNLPKFPRSLTWQDGFEKQVWHRCIPVTPQLRSSWDANNFFDDPKVVELCKAIFDGNVKKMEELIEEGVDVDSKGECNMNPLYWAFHLNTDPRPFGCLMKHGADPNVIVNMRGRKEKQAVFPGYSVTNLAMRGYYNRHLRTIFENGGDPNLVNEDPTTSWQHPVFFEIWSGVPDLEERLMLMIEHGADLNIPTHDGVTFLMANCSKMEDKRCSLAIIAIEKGNADHLVSRKSSAGEYAGCYLRIIHDSASILSKIESEGNEAEHPNFYKLVAKLEELGESMEEAKEDLARWKKWKEEGRMDLIEEEFQLTKQSDH